MKYEIGNMKYVTFVFVSLFLCFFVFQKNFVFQKAPLRLCFFVFQPTLNFFFKPKKYTSKYRYDKCATHIVTKISVQ
jgi:hypothetical protein